MISVQMNPIKSISTKDISYLESEKKHTVFHLDNSKKYVSSFTLKRFNSSIELSGFHRISRPYLIHPFKINHIDTQGSSDNVNDQWKNPKVIKKKRYVLKSINDFVMKKIIYYILLFTGFAAHAQFNLDGPPTTVWNGLNTERHTISDGEGGFFAVFTPDYLSSTNRNIYLQRLDSNGNKLWGEKGVKVSDRPEEEILPILTLAQTTSGQKRVIVVWNTNNSVFAQSLTFEGVSQWTENGILITNNSYSSQGSKDVILSLDKTVLYIAYSEWSYSNSLRLQSINIDNGTFGYANNGLSIDYGETIGRVKMDYQDTISGNILIAWEDYWLSTQLGIRAQIFNTNSNQLLLPSYLIISPHQNSSHYQGDVEVSRNIISWRDNIDGNNDIYIQKLNSDGTIAWNSGGIKVTHMSNNQSFPKMAAASDGTTYLIWENTKETNVDSLYCYVTKINPDGSFPWGKQGVRVAQFKFTDMYPYEALEPALAVVNDTVAVFYKDRSFSNSTQQPYMVQKITPQGRLLYGEKGKHVAGTEYAVNINGNATDVMPTTDKGFVLGFKTGHNSVLAKVIPCTNPPTKPVVTHAKLCNSGANALLTASSCSGTVNWYESDLVTRKHTGNSLLISSVVEPVSYYAECVAETGCSSLDLSTADITLLQAEKSITTTFTSANSPAEEETTVKISSTSKVQSTARVDFKSRSVILEPGFEVQQGGVFKAVARVCIDN